MIVIPDHGWDKNRVFRKYKDKDHPAVKNANKKATKELEIPVRRSLS